jgi:hypothetical protein
MTTEQNTGWKIQRPSINLSHNVANVSLTWHILIDYRVFAEPRNPAFTTAMTPWVYKQFIYVQECATCL